jgi:hypothetical protein
MAFPLKVQGSCHAYDIPGAAGTVTGSKYLLEHRDLHV